MDLTHDRIRKPRASQQVFSHFRVKAGLKVGADAYLTKQSLDAGELVDLVRRLSGSGR